MAGRLYLQRTARERLASGALPRVHSECIWGGYGRGDVCSLCGEPIRSNEVEFELPPRAGEAGSPYRFHIPCHDVWQRECEDLQRQARPPVDQNDARTSIPIVRG